MVKPRPLEPRGKYHAGVYTGLADSKAIVYNEVQRGMRNWGEGFPSLIRSCSIFHALPMVLYLRSMENPGLIRID